MTTRRILARDRDLTIRNMQDDGAEYERMTSWRNRPHVREWWDPDDGPSTVEEIIDEYRCDVTGESGTTACIIELEGAPIGFTQVYPWAADQDVLDEWGLELPEGAWGIDTFIGEPDQLGRGLGRRAIRLVSDHLMSEHGARAIALGVEVGNFRALRMYRAAGMVAVRDYLDSDMRGGKRVTCTLMLRRSHDPPL